MSATPATNKHNALLMLTYDVDFGAGNEEEYGQRAWRGSWTLSVARLYRLDDDNKIKTEHVTYYMTPN